MLFKAIVPQEPKSQRKRQKTDTSRWGQVVKYFSDHGGSINTTQITDEAQKLRVYSAQYHPGGRRSFLIVTPWILTTLRGGRPQLLPHNILKPSNLPEFRRLEIRQRVGLRGWELP